MRFVLEHELQHPQFLASPTLDERGRVRERETDQRSPSYRSTVSPTARSLVSVISRE